jgi:transcriptional regulator with XRE-family HTH domain
VAGKNVSGEGAFGDLLRAYRQAANLTQEALAERSGMSVEAIGALERGERRSPRPSTVEFLAEALKLDAAQRQALVAAARGRIEQSDRIATPLVVPRELPKPPGDFTGRSEELATLLDGLAHEAASGPTLRPAMISAIDGMAGVGKSALAFQAAHLLTDAGAFPDGQLYVDLHGDPPPAPVDVLGRMLRALGMNPGVVPHDLDEAAARFRSLTSGRRLLVLLDNASGVDHVQPLLPGTSTCKVIVTSREVLATLPGARLVHLDVLSHDQALELLGRIAGRERLLADGQAATDVLRWCAQLPLAVRIAGARLAARPSWPVGELARQLADATHRLEALQLGELGVRASFEVSLRGLEDRPEPTNKAVAANFGLFSLLDGPDFSVPVAARLLDQPESVAQTMLERLVDARLLDTTQPGR